MHDKAEAQKVDQDIQQHEIDHLKKDNEELKQKLNIIVEFIEK